MQFKHHWRVPGVAESSTHGLYRLLCRSSNVKHAVGLVHRSVQSSLLRLQSLPVRQKALLTSLEQVCTHAAAAPPPPVPTEKDVQRWQTLSNELQEHTATFTSNLILQNYSPALVNVKHKEAIREILWHSHSSHLALESLLSLHFPVQEEALEKIPVASAVDNIMQSCNALSIEKYGVSPPIALDVVVCEATQEGAHVPYANMTVPELRKLLGYTAKGSTAKKAKGTTREQLKKAALVQQAEEMVDNNGAAQVLVDLQEIYYIEYCVVELLKNSYGTMIDRYGALDVEEETPIRMTMTVHPEKGWAGLRLIDTGMGMGEVAVQQCFEPLYTSVKEEQEDPWRYSRTFGARFAGAGLGLFKTQVYMDFLGATGVEVRTDEGVGTRIDVTF